MTEQVPNTSPSAQRDIFITHHTPDMDHIAISTFEGIAKQLKETGFSMHRFDVRWKKAFPNPLEQNDTYLGKSALLAQAAYKQGLRPIVILSTPPEWAYKHTSPEKTKRAFHEYITAVKHHFDRLQVPITNVQILNELNNPVYTPKKLLSQIPSFVEDIQSVFGEDVDVSSTIILAKPFLRGEQFIKSHTKELSSLTSIGLDFYPGSYQHNRAMLSPKSAAITARQVLEAVSTKASKHIRTDFLKLLTDQMMDTTSLRSILTSVQTHLPGKHIDIGEFGFPSIAQLQQRNQDHDTLQSYAVEKIATAMTPVIDEFNIRNIGFYELFDEREFGTLNWGILNDNGDAKVIMSRLPSLINLLQRRQTASST